MQRAFPKQLAIPPQIRANRRASCVGHLSPGGLFGPVGFLDSPNNQQLWTGATGAQEKQLFGAAAR